MVRRVFFSFHYERDASRAAQVRNMGAVEGNRPVADNDWETVKKGGDAAIKKWIDEQIKGKSCAVVLIGTETAKRKWIQYEIKHAWEEDKGVLGIYIHKLKDLDGNQCRKGANPFRALNLDGIVRAYDPPRETSQGVYSYIKNNIEGWVETAIDIRKKY